MAANSRFAMATHIMAAVGLKKDDLVTSSYLADSLNTNPVVVRRILSELQKAGLVTTYAGRSGGAELAKKAQGISLYDIYSAIDDDEGLFAYNPNDPNKTCSLSCEIKSVLEPVFLLAQKSMTENLKKIKLSELIEDLKKRCAK